MAIATDLFITGSAGRLAVRTKRGPDTPYQAVIMVQGSNLTGQAMFDFSTPELTDYSLMDAMVARGFLAVTFAIRGYGQSEAPDDPFTVTTDTAMEDLASVIDWVTAEGYARPHVLAFSWGGRIAGRYAEANADRIGRLILYDPARGGGNPVLPAPKEHEAWWTNARAHYDEKLEPDFTAPELRHALGDYVTEHENSSPNGVRRENAGYVQPVDPTKITSPTLMIYGVEAAKAPYMQGGMTRPEFFEKLATHDKAFVIVPGGGDFAHLQGARFRLVREIAAFLNAGG